MEKDFEFQTSEAQNGMKVANELLKWFKNNKEYTIQLNSYLTTFFSIWTATAPTKQSIREQVWIRFSQFVSSAEYTLLWQYTYKIANINGSSILSFYITFNMFTTYLKTNFSTPSNPSATATYTSLTYDEECSLWYIGGYIIRQLIKKVKKSASVYNNEKLELLEKFKENNSQGDCEQKMWVQVVNRGGLIYCSSKFYTFIHALEILAKNQFNVILPTSNQTYNLDKMKEEILTNNTIVTSWHNLCLNIDVAQQAKNSLLKDILTFYLAFRGNAHASRSLEQLKKTRKKTIQKSKSLRSKLQY